MLAASVLSSGPKECYMDREAVIFHPSFMSRRTKEVGGSESDLPIIVISGFVHT